MDVGYLPYPKVVAMLKTSLLAVHITIAIALTMTVGVQCGGLALLRDDAPTPTTLRVLRAALWWIPGLALLTFGTGAAVLAEGARGGPWVGAGVLSTLAIATASLWLLRRLRRDITRRTPMVGAVQWGIPAMTLAAAYLMADRPQNPLLAIAPVAIAVAVAALAWGTAARASETPRRAGARGRPGP
jgi:hypothetical protein